ncbi:MAG: DNA methyltransferase, partial [Candidatus Pacearchaeota archaeon]
MSLKLDIEFLKNKGFFKQQETDEYGILDLKNKMLYVTTSDREWVKEVIKDITKTDVSYVWFFNPRSYVVYVYRNYGEVKWFTFNPNFKRTDYIKSKEDKINKFSPENVDVLFDVKYIVESFYKELWKIRIKMAESIKNLQDDKNKLLAAQKFIDRLIFTYFLAQLNVLTINIEEREWKLTKETVRKFFNWLNEKLSEFKLFSILTELFFDVFGEDENKRNFITFQVEDQKIKFEGPFLDGTIFREGELEGIKERKIEITSGIKDLFNLLNNYNWVVGEVLPEDEEVISVLTPEILGHIYEKFIISLENFPDLKRIKLDQLNVTQEEFRVGRQKIGAYYTPEEITTYICKNTIEPYLLDKLNGKYKNVEELLNSLSDRDKKQAIEILKNIKICDNACGSGAFLVKAAEILFRLRKSLGEETEDYEIKREIITTNLYGVDIMEGAIEIARLRLWLWLISSSNSKIEIQPLPNLEFNIMCGNSLIGYIELPQKWGAKLSDDPQKIRKLMEERDQLINKYKETHDSEKAKKMKSDIEKISKEIRLELNKRLFHELESKGIEIKWDEFIELKPFHWGFEFYEVFNPYKSKE